MISEDRVDPDEPYILIEGPRWGDAEFYAKWLSAAANAERLWKKAQAEDPHFAEQIDRLQVVYSFDFGISATYFLGQLTKEFFTMAIRVDSEDGEFISVMVEMGFFVLTGERYQMVIPPQLDLSRVKKAALKLAQTEDADYVIHPELIVRAMPFREAKAWQRRLGEMDERQRLCDRRLLIEDWDGAPT